MNSFKPLLPGTMTRRAALGLGLGLAATAALAACTPGGATGGAGGGGGSAGGKLTLPTYVAPKAVEGAVVSKTPGVATAYTAFGTPYQSVPKIPGQGGTVTTFQPLFRSPPPALDQNQWWQSLNKQLGVEIKPTLAPGSSYADKLATTVAGGQIPDLTVVSLLQSPGAAKLVQQGAFMDLSERLGGDAVKEFPNLAAIPTQAWQDSTIENRLYGIPHTITSSGYLYRGDWAATLGYPDLPKNADEAKELLTAFTKAGPDGNATGDTYVFGKISYGMDYVNAMFNVPNTWKEEKGKFTSYIETDEFEAALKYSSELWAAGVWHPDSASENGELAEDGWLTGQAAFYGTAMVPLYDTFFVPGAASFLPPGHDGGDPSIWVRPAMYGFTALPASIKDEKRVTELLNILNFWAAPFGSQEYLFMSIGLEGRQFNWTDGLPIPVDDTAMASERNLYWMADQYEAQLFVPGQAERTLDAQKQLEAQFAAKSQDPSWGLVSSTSITKAATLKQMITDYTTGIISGRRKLSELDDLRSRWKSGGGETIKKEFADSFAEANG